MGATRNTFSRRSRRVFSAVLAGLLALGGGAALVVSGAVGPAQADPGDVFFLTPEGTAVTHSPFQFTGEAAPGDDVTITSSYGSPCHATANTEGLWSCDMVFTASTLVTVITVARDVDDENPYTQESDGQEHPILLPVDINETSPGQILTNDDEAPITGSGAAPGATMVVWVDNVEATCVGGPADGAGNWSCNPPNFLDGSYFLNAQQATGLQVSDATNSTYIIDRTTFIPRITSPYDSNDPPINIATSDTTPTISGGGGTAEPFATVHVLATDFGTTPPDHLGGIPAFDLWCDAVANSDGAWECTGPAMSVGHFWEISVWATDQAGNTSASPDDEFAIEILPPPDAPVVINPSQGFGELSPFVVNGTVDDVTVNVYVVEGEDNYCGAIAPIENAFACAPNLSPGPHSLEFVAVDIYGTSTSTFRDVYSWPQPTVDTPRDAMTTSAPTITIAGDAPIGADVSVRLDGSALCSPVPFGTTHFECETGYLSVGWHDVAVDYTDPWGTASETISREFDIVPQAAAPTITLPVIGYKSPTRVVHVAGTSFSETTVFVREGAFDLCPPISNGGNAFSCNTVPLSIGTHTIEVSQLDYYGEVSLTATRVVTILPPSTTPSVAPEVFMKTFAFTFRVLGADGKEVGPDGLDTGDTIRIEATGVPLGTLVQAEIHSTPIALGSKTAGQSGELTMVTTVPAVEPGAHEIVLSASGPGYWPAAYAVPVEVHGLKEMPDELPTLSIKEMGEPSDTTEPADGTGAAGSGPGGGTEGNGLEDPTEFGSSLESPFDAQAQAFQLTAAGIALTGSLGLAFLLLVGLPAELLESTIRSNYERAFGWLARIRRRVAKIVAPIARVLANPWIGSGITILAASILLGFADPGYGFNGASVRLTIAMLLAVLAINVGLTAIVMRVAHSAFDVRAMLRPMPAALFLVAISVLVSRLLGISPGFLFGVVLGVAYMRELRLRDEGRLGALGVGLTLAAGLLAWLGYGIASTASGPGFWNNLAIETFAAITLEALGTLVIAMLPIDFLDGRTIFRWSKPAWIGLYLATALVFLFVVVPMSGNWGTMSAPIFGWGTLFVVFGVVAIATWALFRRFPRKSAGEEATTPSSKEDAEAPRR
jgi:hypothetical protein